MQAPSVVSGPLDWLSEMLARFRAPEASWRRPDPAFREMVRALSFLLSVPIYSLKEQERDAIGHFYSDFPELATFVVLRIRLEAAIHCPSQGEDRSAQIELSAKALHRLFGLGASAALINTFEQYNEQNPDHVLSIAVDAEVLANAAVKDARVVSQLRDYEEALARGVELSDIDSSLRTRGPEYLAFVGKHWLVCGDRLTKAFGAWQAERSFRQGIEKMLGG